MTTAQDFHATLVSFITQVHDGETFENIDAVKARMDELEATALALDIPCVLDRQRYINAWIFGTREEQEDSSEEDSYYSEEEEDSEVDEFEENDNDHQADDDDDLVLPNSQPAP